MKIKRCEIVSLLEKDGKELLSVNKVKEVLATRKCIRDYSYIIHDKDTYTASDEEANAEHGEGSLKPAHIHILLRFKDNQPQDTKFVAKWFGVAENFINKINGKWSDAVLYQTHGNAPDKYQYSPDEVCCNFDYQKAIAEKNEKKGREYLESVLQRILSGEIREYNKTREIDKMTLVIYSRQINEAFKVWQNHLEATAKSRNTIVFFITGKSGAGKTALAKRIAEAKGLEYYISSGSNDVMDGYAGQPILILDDLRPSCLGLSDLLKMLDNHNVSSVKSRYKNKFLNCEIIIITTVLDIDTFYDNVFSEQKEPITQLKRRCGIYVKMDMENVYVSKWDNNKMRYTVPVCYINDIVDGYILNSPLTENDVKQDVNSFMPFLKPDNDIFNLTPITKKSRE